MSSDIEHLIEGFICDDSEEEFYKDESCDPSNEYFLTFKNITE